LCTKTSNSRQRCLGFFESLWYCVFNFVLQHCDRGPAGRKKGK
jgi:hypothetical protein